MKITKEPLNQATADRESQKPLQQSTFAQVDAESDEVTINNDHVLMPLINNQNYGYIGKFWVGSGEPQEIKILLDTGSANSWISGFDKEKTTDETFTEPESHGEVKITFGSGYLRGYFVTDQLTIGNSVDADDKLVLDDYMFGMVTEQTCFHDTFDAIIGLAYPEFAEPGVVPLFD